MQPSSTRIFLLLCGGGALASALALSSVPGCGRTASDDGTGTGGATGGSSGAAESGGAAAVGGTGGTAVGSGGASSGGNTNGGGNGGEPGYPPLEPTPDCIHPDVVEHCEGKFCRIEPGCFIMGVPPGEFGRALVAEDQVQVTLTHTFWIGRTEVTRAEWAETGLPVPELVQLNGEIDCTAPDCPQGSATPYDMFGYANRRSEMDGLEPCYSLAGTGCTGSVLTDDYVCPKVQINANSPYECEGYRLPMEAEWEYAARAGTKTSFPSGNITKQDSPSDCHFDAALDAVGWYCENSSEQVRPVAQKAPNAWGLHDMQGNVLEVVNDLYGPSGYLVGPYGQGEGPLINPTGAINAPEDITTTEDGLFRVGRGGFHNFTAAVATVSSRFGGLFDTASASNIGFRIARTIH